MDLAQLVFGGDFVVGGDMPRPRNSRRILGVVSGPVVSSQLAMPQYSLHHGLLWSEALVWYRRSSSLMGERCGVTVIGCTGCLHPFTKCLR